MGSLLISKIANEALDLLYPPGIYCNCCAKITDNSRTYGLCNDCMESISWITGRSCSRCGKALTENDSGEFCYYCRHHEHFFDRGFACCEYGIHEKTLLYELKYASRGSIGKIIGEIIYDKLSAELGEELKESYDYIVPIPIHTDRKQRRGFNQSALIARELSKRSGIACEEDLMLRSRATQAMKGLGPSERRANIQGAFEIRKRKLNLIPKKRFIIIDDIFTTGATMDEAASVLKSAGAARVDFAVFAAGADIITS